jgi:hypothetical protein
MVADAAVDRGIQRITFRKDGRTGHATVLVVDDTAFVRGDRFMLESYMGFSPAGAAAAADKWIRVEKTHSWYPTVAAAVRLGSAIDQLKLSIDPRLKNAGDTTFRGQRVTSIRGRATGVRKDSVVTLYVQSGGSRLPVAEVERGATMTVSTVLSGWNEPVNVSAPATSLVLR